MKPKFNSTDVSNRLFLYSQYTMDELRSKYVKLTEAPITGKSSKDFICTAIVRAELGDNLVDEYIHSCECRREEEY